MKLLVGLIALLSIASVLEAAEIDPSERYTVICDYIGVEPDPRYLPEDFETNDEQSLKLVNATVVISTETVNEHGETQYEKLASKQLENGRAVLEGETSDPMMVTIAIESETETLLSARTVLAPRDVVSVAILDYRAQLSRNKLALIGRSQLAENPEKKFTIVGNLSSVDWDLSKTTATVSVYGHDETINFGTVLLKEGCFLIEGEIVEPTVVHISISTGEMGYGASTNAIVEPKSVIRVLPDGPVHHQLFTTSGAGKHLQLIESWLQSLEYRDLVDAYTVALDELYAEVNTRREILSRNADATFKRIEETDLYKRKEQLWEQLWTLRQNSRNSIAKTASDPFDRLLALEMGAYFRNASIQLRIYDELALLLDEDLVARRVKPARDALFDFLQNAANRRSLDVGDKAPHFVLPNVDGEEVALSDVLDENELILIDFWASWCAPCIAQFPILKELYAEYNENGFEIVTISIDDTLDEWKMASIKQELPWLDLAAIGGFSVDVPLSYGIFFVPMNYLLDSKGGSHSKGHRT
ncbi:MAG: TlpA disulfide reductase family protein [Gammaproteobacteria bacterium]|nr:TlpA disulfide reductase family protein [Gammaproteobacteria bacterium]